MGDLNELDARKLRKYLYGEAFVHTQDVLYSVLEKDPLFNDGLSYDDIARMSLDEYRHHMFKRARAISEYSFWQGT